MYFDLNRSITVPVINVNEMITDRRDCVEMATYFNLHIIIILLISLINIVICDMNVTVSSQIM